LRKRDRNVKESERIEELAVLSALTKLLELSDGRFFKGVAEPPHRPVSLWLRGKDEDRDYAPEMGLWEKMVGWILRTEIHAPRQSFGHVRSCAVENFHLSPGRGYAHFPGAPLQASASRQAPYLLDFAAGEKGPGTFTLSPEPSPVTRRWPWVRTPRLIQGNASLEKLILPKSRSE
jgi:hypothetical protein